MRLSGFVHDCHAWSYEWQGPRIAGVCGYYPCALASQETLEDTGHRYPASSNHGKTVCHLELLSEIPARPATYAMGPSVNSYQFFSALWIGAQLPEWFTPVLDLDEMQTYTGVIEHLYRHTRKNPSNRLRLKGSNGKVTELIFVSSHTAYQYLEKLTEKDVVKVWAQSKWRTIFYGPARYLQQVQHNENLVFIYK
jgi:hypothetical protein